VVRIRCPKPVNTSRTPKYLTIFDTEEGGEEEKMEEGEKKVI
jgi:hypothetical protein